MDKQNPSEPKKPSRKQNQINAYVKYSGLAFQMAAFILFGYWIGKYIDHAVSMRFPLFTILFILLFLSASFFSLYKSLPKD